jgi:hypothetical protein
MIVYEQIKEELGRELNADELLTTARYYGVSTDFLLNGLGVKHEQLYFELFASMWDKGINTFDKLNKAFDILITNQSDPEAAFHATEYLIDEASQPSLPYNPYRKLLEKYIDRQCQEVAINA